MNVIQQINKLQKNPYHINSWGKKTFDKIQHLFLIKTINKLGIEATSST